MKKCSRCGSSKHESDFYSRKSGRVSSPCKQCASDASRARYLLPEIKEAKILSARESYYEDIGASRERRREAYHKNPGPAKERSRQRYLKDPKASHEATKKRRRESPEKVRKADNRRKRERRLKDPVFCLVGCLRKRIWAVLAGKSKSAPSLALLGCPAIEWRDYLEAKFRPGMTWENYGRVWHVDHKRPCAKFDLSDPEQQKACFHWSNTQPLFVEENLKKGSA